MTELCERVVCDEVVCVCVTKCVCERVVRERRRRVDGRWTGVTGVHHRRARTPHKDVWNKNPTQRCGEQ